MNDGLIDGRKLQVLNVINHYDREALAVDAGLSYLPRAVIGILEHLMVDIGTPIYKRCDNGTEFNSKLFMN